MLVALDPKSVKSDSLRREELNSVFSNADDDETLCVHYPPLQELEKPARVGITCALRAGGATAFSAQCRLSLVRRRYLII